MNYKLKIKIKKNSQPSFLCWCVILIPFMFGTLINLLQMSNTVKYVLDVIWVLLLGFMLLNFMRKRSGISKDNKILYIWIVAFLVFTLIAYVANYQSVLYYLWGFRNNFRFYIVFFAFIMFLNAEDIYSFWKFIDFVFWVNIFICFFQYFAMGIKQDYLGGIFGTAVGCNGYLNIFLVLVISKSIIFCLNKKEKLWMCILKSLSSLLVCAYAELKFFYIEFVVILILAVIITDFSWRKLSITIVGIIGVVLTTQLLENLFPQFQGIFTVDAMIESTYEGGYSSEVSLNRLNTIPVISKEFLTTLPQKIFGLGLGNCDTAAYSIVNTPFYNRYAHLRYNWFSTAFTYLETGFVGLVFFFIFFVIICILTFKLMKCNLENKIYYQVTEVVSVCCILIGIYNASLRMESGYVLYFVLAVPFILHKGKLMNEGST